MYQLKNENYDTRKIENKIVVFNALHLFSQKGTDLLTVFCEITF